MYSYVMYLKTSKQPHSVYYQVYRFIFSLDFLVIICEKCGSKCSYPFILLLSYILGF